MEVQRLVAGFIEGTVPLVSLARTASPRQSQLDTLRTDPALAGSGLCEALSSARVALKPAARAFAQ